MADNRTAEKGRYDNKVLAGLLESVADDLTGLGYTAEDLDALNSVADDIVIDPDSDLDDDDEPLDVASQEETAARLQRAKSLKARVINNIDSAIAWVRRNGMGRAWHSAPASLPWPT